MNRPSVGAKPARRTAHAGTQPIHRYQPAQDRATPDSRPNYPDLTAGPLARWSPDRACCEAWCRSAAATRPRPTRLSSGRCGDRAPGGRRTDVGRADAAHRRPQHGGHGRRGLLALPGRPRRRRPDPGRHERGRPRARRRGAARHRPGHHRPGGAASAARSSAPTSPTTRAAPGSAASTTSASRRSWPCRSRSATASSACSTSRPSQRREFAPAEVRRLSTIASLLAGVVERRRLHLETEAQLDGLRSVDQARAELIAVVTHQLRTPLAVVRAYLDLLAETAEARERRRGAAMARGRHRPAAAPERPGRHDPRHRARRSAPDRRRTTLRRRRGDRRGADPARPAAAATSARALRDRQPDGASAIRHGWPRCWSCCSRTRRSTRRLAPRSWSPTGAPTARSTSRSATTARACRPRCARACSSRSCASTRRPTMPRHRRRPLRGAAPGGGDGRAAVDRGQAGRRQPVRDRAARGAAHR